MTRRFDLVVIGSGVAARSAAMRVKTAGRTVAVVDRRPFGGTCMLRGCDPKKLLREAPRLADAADLLRGHGIDKPPHTLWSDMMAFKRSFTDGAPEQQEQMWRDAGVEPMQGRARFIGPNKLLVEGAEGAQEIEEGQFLLAIGAQPVPLGIEGVDILRTSDEFLDLEDLPRRIVFVGGGYIAAEFACIAARAGAEVTVLQRGPRMLEGFEAGHVEALMGRFRDMGIDVRTNAEVRAVRKEAAGVRVEAVLDGGEQSVDFTCDAVFHAAGRKPDFAALDPRAAGLDMEEGFPVLDKHLRSRSNPAIWAAGDASGNGPPLTPTASLEGQVVAANILDGPRHVPNYDGIPAVAFTFPPIASVGLDEEAARKAGLDVRVSEGSAGDWFTARVHRQPVYAWKVLIDRASDHVVGAHLVGPDADATVNIFALAIRHRISAEALKSMPYAYPTAISDVSGMIS